MGHLCHPAPPHIKDDGWQRSSDSRIKKCHKKGSPPFLLPGNKELVVVQLDMAVSVLVTHSYLVPKRYQLFAPSCKRPLPNSEKFLTFFSFEAASTSRVKPVCCDIIFLSCVEVHNIFYVAKHSRSRFDCSIRPLTRDATRLEVVRPGLMLLLAKLLTKIYIFTHTVRIVNVVVFLKKFNMCTQKSQRTHFEAETVDLCQTIHKCIKQYTSVL